MSAVVLWVRAVARRRRAATLFVALLIGMPAGIVATAFEGQRRAAGSLDRFLERTRVWDVSTEPCPADIVEANPDADAPTLRRLCFGTAAFTDRFRAMLAKVPEVEATALADPFRFAVLDPSAPNGWGWRMGSPYVFRSPGVPIALDGAVLRSGRWPTDDAADEIAIDEVMASELRLHVGSTITIAGWTPEALDVNSGVRPDTVPFSVDVVGIARTGSDIVDLFQTQPFLRGEEIAGRFMAGAGWARAHLDSLGRYSTSTIMRLRHGRADVAAVRRAMEKAGWVGGVAEPIGEIRPVAARVIRDERDATIAFAWLGFVVTAMLGLLVTQRQIRSELGARPALEALGFDRRMLVRAVLIRSLTMALPAGALAVIIAVAGSAFTPFGTAGRIDDTGPRVSPMISALTIAAIVVGVALAGLLSLRLPKVRTAAPSALKRMFASRPTTLVAASLTRGSGPLAAATASTLAVAALVGGGVAVASYDSARITPAAYGAWFDATINLWPTHGKPGERTRLLGAARELPGLESMTMQRSPYSPGSIGQASVQVIGLQHLRGPEPRLPMRTGRNVDRPGEVVLDLRTARSQGLGVGDDVDLVVDMRKQVLRVVGVSYPFDTCGDCGANGFAIVHRSITDASPFATDVVQLGFRRGTSQTEIVERIRRTPLKGFAAVPITPISLSHLGTVRVVPRLIAGVVGLFAFATLFHALLTLLRRRQHDFAVLTALGLDRAGQRATRTCIGALLTLTGTVIGVPFGVVGGRLLWRVYTDRLLLVPVTRVPIWPVVAAPTLALAIAGLVGALTGRAHGRNAVASALRAE